MSLATIMTAACETAYYWDLKSDKIVWASNAPAVLRISEIGLLRTGKRYDSLILEGLHGPRRDAILQKSKDHNSLGVAFSVHYRFGTSRSGEPLWLEDRGRWKCDVNGTPITAKGIVRVITDRYVREKRLDFLRHNDQLTGQFNRGELFEAISDALMTADEDEDENIYAVLLISINNLDIINEAFGFETGDEVIAAVARRLRFAVRDTDIIGRFSSNIFGLLLADMGPAAMEAAADRLLRLVRDEVIETSFGPVAVTINIGGVLIPKHAKSVAEAIGHAQEALAKAKNKPHDIFVPSEPTDIRQEIRKRNREVASDLVRALRDERLLLALQPIVDATTLKPAIHECLLRIKTVDGRIISAGKYIPIAENLGLIRLLDYRVLELAIDVAHQRPELHLTINVSGLTTSDGGWLELLSSLIDGDTTLARRLIIEITETAALQDIDESCRFVQYVKELGCKVAMDDFGTGYNSFRNLQLLGLDMVKIDGSFIENMRINKDDQLFVRTLTDLARQFGLKVVAENVGDEDTVKLLQEAGVTYLQGFHFGEPLPIFPRNPRLIDSVKGIADFQSP